MHFVLQTVMPMYKRITLGGHNPWVTDFCLLVTWNVQFEFKFYVLCVSIYMYVIIPNKKYIYLSNTMKLIQGTPPHTPEHTDRTGHILKCQEKYLLSPQY